MRLLFLHGPAAAGKFTVARELAARTGFALYHNHLVVDEVLQRHAFGTPEFVAERDRLWRAYFHEHPGSAQPDVIFTFNPENSVPQEFVDWLFEALPRRGVHLCSVELCASEEALEGRLGSDQRQQFGKLTDVALYRRLREQGVFHTPFVPRTDLRLDTTDLAPDAAAERIVQRFQLELAERAAEPICDRCQRPTARGDLVQIGRSCVCAACKALELQRLREHGPEPGDATSSPALRGVRGWLLTFCIYHVLFAPLMLALYVALSWQELTSPSYLGSHAMIEDGVSGFLILLCGGVGLLLWSGHRRAPSVALRCLYFSLVCSAALHVFRVLTRFDASAEPGQFLFLEFPVYALDLSILIAWIVYLKRSRRVRNTYGQPAER